MFGDADQAVRMRRLILVFAGHTCSLVGNDVPRLISCYLQMVSRIVHLSSYKTDDDITYITEPAQKQQNSMCAKQRLRSVWASAQSDLSLCCALNG